MMMSPNATSSRVSRKETVSRPMATASSMALAAVGPLDREIAADQRLVRAHLLDRRGLRDTAILDEETARSGGPHEIEILLDEQDREVPFPRDFPHGAADLVDDGRLYPLRGLVEEKKPRLADQRAHDRELLLLTAGKGARPLAATLAEDRKA